MFFYSTSFLHGPYICFVLLFFFSSRRRHTRWPRDWSSDVWLFRSALLEHARSEDGAAGLETDPAADVEESDGREPAGAEADDTTIRHQDTVDLTPLPGFDEPPAPRGEQGKIGRAPSELQSRGHLVCR